MALIYGVNNGYLDDIEISEIGKWEETFREFLVSSKGTLLNDIEKTWDEKIENDLKSAFEEFKSTRK
ncbi:MAG: ATP synthase subunit alpha [Parcubacteria group bacterium GW2011_GWE2_40_8]|nr:MAG: ATP synthase subunit alpha [Parcubacteria group bacterium GW2011_GWE2_40_8]